MRKYIFFSIIACLAAGCSEDVIDTYHAPQDNVYFDVNDNNSLIFSFADTSLNVTEVTLLLPVKLSGERVSHDRSLRLEVVDTATSAQSGLHYAPLSTSYALPADSGVFMLPVTLFNKDELLTEQSLTIGLRLLASDDLGVSFPNLTTAKITFSSRLEQPDWWIYWMGELGVYSRTKHYLFLVSSGTKSLHNPSVDFFSTPKALYHISEYKAFMTDPFTWVTKHTDYALDRQADNNYLFYLKATPEKVYDLIYEPESGKYYFKDENGAFIFI
ncbi:MAG: DUF4843 domain-containing protein [Dysgonamonadaceae bacterium]|jgi:hypothetical protein|nr:DUF4843 domain-containing protein [Dysgonamonadaceae bacterium]